MKTDRKPEFEGAGLVAEKRREMLVGESKGWEKEVLRKLGEPG